MKKSVKQKMYRVVGFLFAIALFASSGIILWAATLDIPDLDSFEQRKISQSTKIYDRTGEVLLFDLHQDIQRTIIPFGDISRNIKNATVAIEDTEFYEHKGVRPLATFRAVFIQPLRGKGIQGGSTITQQVVKNSILTNERKVSRKIKEWVLSLKLEKALGKEEILALYLNETPYGGNLYGVEEASQAFFNRSASELSIAESAYLAALPQAPTFYSPYGNNRSRLEERKNLVLSRMLENNFITKQEYDEAKEEDVEFQPQQNINIKAPHFVFFIQEYLEQKYGKRAIEERGFRVITTLDYKLEQEAEKIVKDFALKNKEKFNAENAGLVAIDPKTGQILVMVGSRDYFDEEIDGNFNVALALRQPGSAFKPFVYATAFKKGYTPETTVFDLETQFSSTCREDDFEDKDECYSPGNYDEKFRGPITFRNALAQSVNVPAVKALYLSGLSDSLNTARDMGITTLTDINRYGLTLVLGGGEVTPLEMTSAYGVFANDGVRNDYTGILRIEDSSGNVVEEFSKRPAQVLEPKIARQISSILSDDEARAPLYGRRSPLYFPERDVAAKTGTTNNYLDAWIIGYTPNISVGVWAGNNIPKPMNQISGLIVTPMWRAFMEKALEDLPSESFKKPDMAQEEGLKPVLKGEWRGGERYTIDTISGKLATDETPPETRSERVLTDIHSILYWVDKNNPRAPKPEKPENDPQFRLWEYPVREWVKRLDIVEGGMIPKEFDDVHTKERKPSVSVLNINETQAYSLNAPLLVRIAAVGTFPIQKADYYVNGIFVGSSSRTPFSFTFLPYTVKNISTKNTLKVVVYDSVFNRNEIEVPFRIVF